MNSPTIKARDVPPRAIWALEQAGVTPLLARLFAARGVRSADDLDDGLAKLLPPNTLLGAEAAAQGEVAFGLALELTLDVGALQVSGGLGA